MEASVRNAAVRGLFAINLWFSLAVTRNRSRAHAVYDRQAFERLRPRDKPILHSDQGWQYRMPIYRRVLSERAVKPSMSRKGNCYDNAAMESFFGG
ncbi:hypothetical protein ALQ85_200058 [Pseudomonas syringae]|nr:hypothetical protein ALQ85_200058 [Pseudomonas syringae]